MKRVLVVVGILASVVLTCVIGLSAWLYLYTADLPPTSELSAFKPASETKTQFLSCDGTEEVVIALPREKLGSFTLAALTAAEGPPIDRSPFVAFLFAREGPHVVSYQAQLARTLACNHSHLSHLKRQFQELRLANAINRKFSQQEILTIYLNRIYLGPNTYGVEAGAQKYFGKDAPELTLEESALLVGMIGAPSFYSPASHPDRATQRRNSILDEMVAQGTATKGDSDRAKAAPIHILQ